MTNNIRLDDNGNIVAINLLSNELPDVSVTFKSGKTLFRFVARCDGEKSLPSRIVNLLKSETPGGDKINNV